MNPIHGCIKNFAPTPLVPFHFPSMVIASTTDPYCSIEIVQNMAKKWGSELKNVGDKHHIGNDAKLGDWTEGKSLFIDFIKKLKNP